MRKYLIATLTISIMVGVSLPSTAQTEGFSNTQSPSSGSADIYFINRAKNLARQAAIAANGGLARYRPDMAMFGPAVQTQYARNDNGSITFTFTGGAPGGVSPNLETVATVASDGTVKLDYNGPLRSIGGGSLPMPTPVTEGASIQSPAPPNLPPASVSATPSRMGGSTSAGVYEDEFLSKARNLARQAAIKTNGGLSRYRPEPSMFGPSGQSPAVKNADGSITFTFKGGMPATAVMTTETVVTVNPTGTVKLDYNGPVR